MTQIWPARSPQVSTKNHVMTKIIYAPHINGSGAIQDYTKWKGPQKNISTMAQIYPKGKTVAQKSL